MEFTRGAGSHYRVVARGMLTEGLDPRPIVMGVASMLLLTPIAVLAVPADLIAAPFRKECRFELQLSGSIVRWASQSVGESRIELFGRNVLAPEAEGVPASFFESRASAVSDAKGAFSLALPGQTGRGSEFWLQWTVSGLASGRMVLQKQGGRFELSEPDPEFGASLESMEPIEIVPQRP